jgi:hypothetical protein
MCKIAEVAPFPAYREAKYEEADGTKDIRGHQDAHGHSSRPSTVCTCSPGHNELLGRDSAGSAVYWVKLCTICAVLLLLSIEELPELNLQPVADEKNVLLVTEFLLRG